MIKSCCFLLFLLFTFFTSSAQLPEVQKITIPGSTLRNIYSIDKRIYRSEQPNRTDFKALEKCGIREVLNLRCLHNDKDEAEGTGITLHHIRTNAYSIDEQEIIEALRIIKNRKGPIVFHCLHGSDRTGAVCAMYRIVFQNISKEEAIRELTEGGFGYHRIFINIISLIRDANIDHIRQEVFK